MQLGMNALGGMGRDMVRRLVRAGHHCIVYDAARDAVRALAREGAVGASSLGDLAGKLSPPRAIWLMVPAAALDQAIADVAGRLQPGDALVDGGNSWYGAGHFVKMVHNGIEYGLMAAYPDGLNVLRHADAGKRPRDPDAETTPLRDPDHYRYDFDLGAIAEVWRRGSVISSWLLDLTAAALAHDPDLSRFAGRVSDSGEGRWTAHAALDEGVPTPVLTTALHQRFSSRGEADFADRILSAMRLAFGGHLEKR